MPRYQPSVIEPRWQRYWEENKTFRTAEMPQGPKLYVLDMFPYPSGDGLHVGHPEGYTATDIVCRFERMRGKSVLHPMGFDAFGLPAEEHAIATNTPPRESTERNIANFRRQLKMLGFSYDWDREIATTDVAYFRWTQWIFLVLFDTWYDPQQKKGRPIAELPIPAEVQAGGETAIRRFQDEHRLAYQADALVNWCPALGTVLANEEVIDGKSERGGHPVVRMPLRQWMLRITSYAERLAGDLDLVFWSEAIKTMQREWIGRSTGAEVDFYIGPQQEFAAWKGKRKSLGEFPRKAEEDVLRIYTTRPDTLFGATYMVIAPEHPFVARLTTPGQKSAVEAYCQAAASKSDLDRTDLAKGKTGVFTGSNAINPVNGEAIPIWIADYVLISYGTGAIMAVPAHDDRDFEFAKQYAIPIRQVVDVGSQFRAGALPQGDDDHVRYSAWKERIARSEIPLTMCLDVGEDFEIDIPGPRIWVNGPTFAINSGSYNGLATAEFKTRITAELAAAGLGREAINYKLRDWLFSRQRFWGEPFPILHELDSSGQPTGMIRPVPVAELPLDLPHLEDFKPHGRPEPPLGKSPDSWLYTVVDGRRCRRETNTMPQWAGSCWYYLRFIDPRNGEAFVDREKERAWMPVDLYVGGAEHAVLHLLYSRFWHKVLFDRGYVSTPEPFLKLVNQGMILGDMEFSAFTTATPPVGGWKGNAAPPEDSLVSIADAFETEEGSHVRRASREPLFPCKLDADSVEKQGEHFVLKARPEIRVDGRSYKMSKSRGNVVNPDQIVRDFGADSLRLYEMFMGPLEATKPWSMTGVSGVRKFLDRAWNLIIDMHAEDTRLHESVRDVSPTDEQDRLVHKTIKAVTDDLERMSFNTAIARLMEFVNFFTRQEIRPKGSMEKFVLLLSPYAPHAAEELWRQLGHAETLAYEPWPQYDPAKVVDDTVEIPVQIKGKVRTKIVVPAGLDQAQLETAARADEKVIQLLAGQQVVKTILVPGRLVNFVTK